jgi:hypothetical protein
MDNRLTLKIAEDAAITLLDNICFSEVRAKMLLKYVIKFRQVKTVLEFCHSVTAVSASWYTRGFVPL